MAYDCFCCHSTVPAEQSSVNEFDLHQNMFHLSFQTVCNHLLMPSVDVKILHEKAILKQSSHLKRLKFIQIHCSGVQKDEQIALLGVAVNTPVPSS